MVVADLLEESTTSILEANAADLKQGEEMGLKGAIVERLTLSEKRIKEMAGGLREIVQLEDPIGEVQEMKKRPNGLVIGQKRVPMGVIGIIYESRPNVTIDVASLVQEMNGQRVVLLQLVSVFAVHVEFAQQLVQLKY